MALYTVRSERLLCEQFDYNLLFRWFLDMEVDEASFDQSTFSRNRARLLVHEIAGEFFRGVVAQAGALRLLSDEHFTVDGTLVEAWASLKSFKRKDARPNVASASWQAIARCRVWLLRYAPAILNSPVPDRELTQARRPLN